MPSQLENAMDALMKVFYNYSGNDGDKYKLNKGELKELLNSELTDFLTVKLTLIISLFDLFVGHFRKVFMSRRSFERKQHPCVEFKSRKCVGMNLCISLTDP